MRTYFDMVFAHIMILILVACVPAQTPATPTLARTDTSLPSPTLTDTPLPTITNTSTPTKTPSPTPTITLIPERKGMIYFASNREGSFDIFKLDLSEGVVQRVTTDSYMDEYFPHPSPDGEWLSYWSVNPHDKSVCSLKILNLTDSKKKWDGTGVNQALGWSTWSPDSQNIAFVLWTFDIFVLSKIDMSALLFSDDIEYYPAWSPDGTTIAYVHMEDDQAKIYLIDSDGKNNRALFKENQLGYSPAWSPDGKMVAFTNGDKIESQIYVINVDGSGLRQLTSGAGVRDDPTWSPDGEWIAFWSNQDGDSEIFAISLDGTGLIQLTENEFYDENPSWFIESTQPSASQTPTGAVATKPATTANIQTPMLITDTFGIKMALVPAGEFQMGSENTFRAAPVHTVYLDSFYIDVYEVTNGMYMACVKASVCTKPRPIRSSTRANYHIEVQYDDYPVINIGRKEAREYCQWRGGDLPTEAQWEKAARGGLEGKKYPWGDEEPSCQAGAFNGAHFSDCSPDDTVKAGSFGANGYGLFDMAGNVSEFVLDWYDNYPAQRLENPLGPSTGEAYVIRGGGWNWDTDLLDVAYRNFWGPEPFLLLGLGDDVTGFRCAFVP